jgi:hypothetical protein
MPKKISNFIFLTRKEVVIHGKYFLSVHLPSDSPRAKRIAQLCEDDRAARLRLVVFDPVLKQPSSMTPGVWYLLPKLRYSGRSTGNGTTNTSFSYDFGAQDGQGSRRLTEEEVRYFRENNHVQI